MHEQIQSAVICVVQVLQHDEKRFGDGGSHEEIRHRLQQPVPPLLRVQAVADRGLHSNTLSDLGHDARQLGGAGAELVF